MREVDIRRSYAPSVETILALLELSAAKCQLSFSELLALVTEEES